MPSSGFALREHNFQVRLEVALTNLTWIRSVDLHCPAAEYVPEQWAYSTVTWIIGCGGYKMIDICALLGKLPRWD
jgi:hypothetical protein